MNRTTAIAGGLVTIAICGTCLQILVATPGCAATADVDVAATMTAALAQVETLQASIETLKATVAHVETTVGTIAIGGGSDSITAWIYALGAVAAMLFYPLGWRPLARKFGFRGRPPIAPPHLDPNS